MSKGRGKEGSHTSFCSHSHIHVRPKVGVFLKKISSSTSDKFIIVDSLMVETYRYIK